MFSFISAVNATQKKKRSHFNILIRWISVLDSIQNYMVFVPNSLHYQMQLDKIFSNKNVVNPFRSLIPIEKPIKIVHHLIHIYQSINECADTLLFPVSDTIVQRHLAKMNFQHCYHSTFFGSNVNGYQFPIGVSIEEAFQSETNSRWR